MPTSALLIIDMQTALVAGAFNEAAVLSAINTTIHRARSAGAPVIFIQHNHHSFEPLKKGNSGWAIHPVLERLDGDLVIEKEASDAFYETQLHSELTRLGATRVAICGMQTEFCVDATARAALSHEFDVVLISDAHTTGPSHLPAADIINHHNSVLPNLAHPRFSIRTTEAANLQF